MTTLITGSTGLVGRDLLNLLSKDKSLKDEPIRLLVRKNSNISGLENMGFDLWYGNIENKESLLEAAKGVDTIIHIVQMRYSPIVVDVANNVNAKRLIIVGTTGIYSNYRLYSAEYEKAEEYIENECQVPYVILRPTMIYGSSKDKNVHKLVNFMNKYHFFPIFGNGKGKMQPIYYKDLSRALYFVYKKEEISNESYNLAGKNELEYRELLKITADELNKKVIILKIPYFITKILVYFYNKVFKKPKIKLEQVKRLTEDKVFDYSKAEKEFGFKPISFQEGIRKQIKSMYKS